VGVATGVRYWIPLLLICGCGLAPWPVLPKLATTPVRVSVGNQNFFQCSGVEIYPDFALTASHCVGNSDAIWVNGIRVKLVIEPNPEWDMAMLHVPGLKGPNVVWVDRKPQVGDLAILVGWGCSKRNETASAKIGRVESIDGRDLTFDVTVCAGDSGGPVFDMQGRLIGLLVRMVASNHHAVVQYLAE
jgi:V8-like Glu-specific endopeptidase